MAAHPENAAAAALATQRAIMRVIRRRSAAASAAASAQAHSASRTRRVVSANRAAISTLARYLRCAAYARSPWEIRTHTSHPYQRSD